MNEAAIAATPHTRRANYTDAVAIQAEGSRVGVVTCLRCGAALLLSMVEDSIGLHDAWHESMQEVRDAVWREGMIDDG